MENVFERKIITFLIFEAKIISRSVQFLQYYAIFLLESKKHYPKIFLFLTNINNDIELKENNSC